MLAACHPNYYRSDPVFQEKSTRRSFEAERYFYPVQQACWVEGVRKLLLQDTPSLAQLRAILPRAVDILKPTEQTDLILTLFQRFAQNPIDEIGGRYLWWMCGGYPVMKVSEAFYFSASKCATTHYALWSSLFGIDSAWSVKIQQLAGLFLQKWHRVECNADRLREASEPLLCAYSITVPAHRSFLGHALFVSQKLDEKGALRYYFFQSFIFVYTLGKYLEGGDNSLSHKEFKSFLWHMHCFETREQWSAYLERLHRRYFKAGSRIAVGEENSMRDNCAIKYGFATLHDFLIQDSAFEAFKRLPRYPRIELLE